MLNAPVQTAGPDKPDRAKAAQLDRVADLHLAEGRGPLAERLAHRAADLRTAAEAPR